MPVAKKGQVLVKVKVCGLNALDWKLQAGEMRPIAPPKIPFISGEACKGGSCA